MQAKNGRDRTAAGFRYSWPGETVTDTTDYLSLQVRKTETLDGLEKRRARRAGLDPHRVCEGRLPMRFRFARD